MIFYFSATGNSRHAAYRIADALGEPAVSILDCPLEHSIPVPNGESLSLVTPVYCGGVPYPVADFLKYAKLEAEPHTPLHFIATYGNYSGASGEISNRYIKKNLGRSFQSRFSVRMPDTWTPVFDLTNSEQVAEINKKAEEEIDAVIDKIRQHREGDFMEDKLPGAMALLYPLMYHRLSKTKNFVVEDSCTGCGLCAGHCPVHAIELGHGKPRWSKPNCVMCLGCLHRCPQFAIQYGNSTKHHGQYQHPSAR